MSVFLTKPVFRAELFDALRKPLLDKMVAEEKTNSPPASFSLPESDELIKKLRILLVEDNPVNQRLATRVLQKLGYNVSVAENGLQAVAAFTESKFDLILMVRSLSLLLLSLFLFLSLPLCLP